MRSKCAKILATKIENHENITLLSIFKSMYYLLTVFGLFPYGVQYKKTTQEIVVTPKSVFLNSVCGLAILLIIYVFYSAHLVYLFQTNEYDYLTDTKMVKMNYIIEMTILLLFTTSAYVCAGMYKTDYVKILNAISSVFNEMPKDDTTKSLSRIRSVVRFLVFVYIILVTTSMICIYLSGGDSLWKMTLTLHSFILPQFIQMVILSFYYTLLTMLVEILKNINDQLIVSQKQSKEELEFDQGRVFYKVDSKPAVTIVKIMERRYAKVFEAKKLINVAFQNPIMLITLNSFHTIVSEAFNLYQIVVYKSPEPYTILCSATWLACQITKVYILARSGASIKYEAIKINQSLHNIPTDKLDIRILMEIQHFSTLIDVQEIKLTVYNFFTLDATLFFNMLATVATYLIILVQFDAVDD